MKEATLWGAPLKIILGKNYVENEIIEVETCHGESICLDEAGLFNFVADRTFQLSRSTTECYANKPYTYNQLLTLKTKSS